MDKEFISFEQAKVLKELGFDETCFMYWKYEPDGKAYKYYFSEPNVENEVGSNNSDEATFVVCTAPLWQQAFEFFRDKYSAHSHISKYKDNNFYHYDIFVDVVEEGEEYYESYVCDVLFNTYEEAQSACLDKLIELAKDR